MKPPQFTIRDIKYSVDEGTLKRAYQLFDTGKVGEISETRNGYTAIIAGTHKYDVYISGKDIDRGGCDCYVCSEKDMLCKHMIALGIAALHEFGEAGVLSQEDASPVDLSEVKILVKEGMKQIKGYSGNSRNWSHYTMSLASGSDILSDAVQELPPTRENAKYLWSLVLRLNKKLSNGVDDSDGAVGGCTWSIVAQLAKYAKEKPELKKVIEKFCDTKTGFGFEDDLRKQL